MVKSFDSFIEGSSKSHSSAGVAIVLDSNQSKKILLVHPTNGSWQKPIMGIPKGQIEDGESVVEAALRETFEETGIRLKSSQLEPEIHTAEVWKGTKFMYSMHYLICRISDLAEIGLTDLKVPTSQLQKSEVDWAGFVEIKDAYSKMLASQRIILDRLG
jgi:predicted NUDIX family NTP pyrophosphohydrolase